MTHRHVVTAGAREAPRRSECGAMGTERQTGGRLSVLDGSFLRLDSPRAPMHVGWSAVFAALGDADRPTLHALRQRAASRLKDIQWCRWKLRTAPLGLTEPRWIEDLDFVLALHVVALSTPEQAVSYDAFAAIVDAFLSEPLDRDRPLWKIILTPRLEDGRLGLIGKFITRWSTAWPRYRCWASWSTRLQPDPCGHPICHRAPPTSGNVGRSKLSGAPRMRRSRC